jgi:hypothetical protein
VVAGPEEGINNTQYLNVLNYNKTIQSSNQEQSKKSVDEKECQRMIGHHET